MQRSQLVLTALQCISAATNPHTLLGRALLNCLPCAFLLPARILALLGLLKGAHRAALLILSSPGNMNFCLPGSLGHVRLTWPIFHQRGIWQGTVPSLPPAQNLACQPNKPGAIPALPEEMGFGSQRGRHRMNVPLCPASNPSLLLTLPSLWLSYFGSAHLSLLWR